MFTGVSAFQMGLIHILAAMMGAGVFERYPTLKVSFGESGIGWVGVRRSNHAGAAGVYAEIPVKQQMVGIYAAVSTANHMAPWGGAEALMGKLLLKRPQLSPHRRPRRQKQRQ